MNLNPWPYQYILKRVKQATLEAQQQGLRPILAKEAVKNYRTSKRFNIPYLGDYEPEGWTLAGKPVYVVTAGKPSSPNAITIKTLFNNLLAQQGDETIGYGVLEQGQAQVLVGKYRKESNGPNQKE